jgi:hypothetical protein
MSNDGHYREALGKNPNIRRKSRTHGGELVGELWALTAPSNFYYTLIRALRALEPHAGDILVARALGNGSPET